jgi:hypothetical protein
MKGNFHVRFLGGRGRATACAYPAATERLRRGAGGLGWTYPPKNEPFRGNLANQNRTAEGSGHRPATYAHPPGRNV